MNLLSPTRRKRSATNGNILPNVMNDFLNDRFFGSNLLTPFSTFTSTLNEIPSANIQETKDSYLIELSAPGLKKNDFNIEVEDGVLTISCEKEEEKEEEEKDYKRREFSYTSFSRSFSLPEGVHEDKINAHYADGILEVKVPKKEVQMNKPKTKVKVD